MGKEKDRKNKENNKKMKKEFKETTKKIIVWILVILILINISYLTYNSVQAKRGNHSFNTSLSPASDDITKNAVLLGMVHILGIGIVILFYKKRFGRILSSFLIACVMAILIIAPFIPVTRVDSVQYHYSNPKNRYSSKTREGTTHTTKIFNLYGIKLDEKETTSAVVVY